MPSFRPGGNSGKVHSDVRDRWKRGDPEVHEGMKALAALVDSAKTCLESGDFVKLAELMDINFAIRRRVYGDAVVGAENIMIAEIASKELNLAAKFTGSGGAFVMLRRDGRGW